MEYLFYKENSILKIISLEKVNIVYYVAWGITGIIYLISQDLSTKNSLKKTKVKSLYIGILIISLYLQKSIDKLEITYMIDVNHKLLFPTVLILITFYHIYNFIILRRFKSKDIF